MPGFVKEGRMLGINIKSIRAKQANLTGSFVSIRDHRAFVDNLNIPKYRFSSLADYQPKRKRELLLSKKEITKIENQLNQQGITVVPLELLLLRRDDVEGGVAAEFPPEERDVRPNGTRALFVRTGDTRGRDDCDIGIR